EEISCVVLPPAGELGILKQSEGRDSRVPLSSSGTRGTRPSEIKALATLLDHLPRETIFLLCEPEQLALRADEYARQIPVGDPFFISWPDFLAQLDGHSMTRLEMSDTEVGVQASACSPDRLKPELQPAEPVLGVPLFSSLDAFRPLAERAPELPVAEAQRREFFQQLHRWLRQDYAV